MCVSVIIPAFNEQQRIKTTIETAFSLEHVSEVIVVDDGSTDKTYQEAIQTKATVFQLAANQGKGAALNQGINRANSDIFLLLDADVGESAIEAQKLLTPVLEGEMDMTVAKFPTAEQKGGFGVVKTLAAWGVKKITGQSFSAPLSGQRVLTKDVIKAVDKFAPGFGVEVALTIAAWQAGFKIQEIPVQMYHRFTTRDWSGFWHRGQQFKDIAFVLASLIRRGN